MSSTLPVDLSDLDPYSPTPSPSPSPQPPTAVFTSSSSTSGGTAAIHAQPQLQSSSQDHPLAGMLGRIHIGSSSSSRSPSINGNTQQRTTPTPPPPPFSTQQQPALTPTTAGQPPSAAVLQTQAQRERQQRVLTDLAREPFASTTTTSPAARGLTTEDLTDEPGSLPSELPLSLSPSHSHTLPRRRSSRSSSSSGAPLPPFIGGFSPPRRLSSLMDLHAHSPPSSSSFSSHGHGVASPPAAAETTRGEVDPFHPATFWGSASDSKTEGVDARSRMREASAGSSSSAGTVGAGGGASSDWGDFQTHTQHRQFSTSPPVSPSRAKPIPVSSPSSPTRADSRSSSFFGAASSSFRAATLPLPLPLSLPHSLPSIPAPLQSALSTAAPSLSSATSSSAAASATAAASAFLAGLNPATLERKGPHVEEEKREKTDAQTHSHAPKPTTRHTFPASSSNANAPGTGTGTRTNGFDPTAQPPVRLVGIRPGVVRVLEEEVAEGIRPSLPPRLRLSSKWTLLYSLDQHGISLHTLFANLERGLRERDGGFVLVVKSEKGEVFGGYCSEALKDASATRGPAQRWAGDGSCFLWKSTPFSPTDFRIGSSVRTFKPTFRNTYYQHASPEFLAFGGGEDGVFGLWIDGVFERGWTGRCETYANEPLVDVKARGGGSAVGVEEGQDRKGRRTSSSRAQEEGKFEVVGFECWAVG
ncbi:hypothetical protein JCM10908_004800 [Rhodotorula pacifica]|uniref:Oxr1p n=1 Tax=Rhodotorula pacifica TaxID=1495444 RepID=UPI00317F8BF4